MGVGGCEGGMLCERRKAEGGRDGGTKGQREGACVCVCRLPASIEFSIKLVCVCV